MTYKAVQGSSLPLTLDYISSPTTVYFRRNIQKITDSYGNTLYEYEEATQPKAEFITQLFESTNLLEDTLQELIVGD